MPPMRFTTVLLVAVAYECVLKGRAAVGVAIDLCQAQLAF